MHTARRWTIPIQRLRRHNLFHGNLWALLSFAGDRTKSKAQTQRVLENLRGTGKSEKIEISDYFHLPRGLIKYHFFYNNSHSSWLLCRAFRSSSYFCSTTTLILSLISLRLPYISTDFWSSCFLRLSIYLCISLSLFRAWLPLVSATILFLLFYSLSWSHFDSSFP